MPYFRRAHVAEIISAVMIGIITTGSSAHASYLSEAQLQERAIIMVANKARPGYIAELEELVAARAAATIEAYDLFLARHPKSRYADIARTERAVLAGKKH